MNTTPSDTGITVYSKPACVQCTMTKKALEKKGLAYTEVDVTKSAAALEFISEDLNYSQAPVVVVDEHHHWSGFRPDCIEAVAAALGRTA